LSQDWFPYRDEALVLTTASLSQGGFKISPDGVICTIAKDEFANAFQRGMNSCEKYICFDCVTRSKNILK
jgi:hypothetical protein